MQGRLPLPAANRWLNWCGGYEESPVTDWGIACRLDSLFALADRIEARLAAAQKQVDALSARIRVTLEPADSAKALSVAEPPSSYVASPEQTSPDAPVTGSAR